MKTYEIPTMEIDKFDIEDVILASGAGMTEGEGETGGDNIEILSATDYLG